MKRSTPMHTHDAAVVALGDPASRERRVVDSDMERAKDRSDRGFNDYILSFFSFTSIP